MKMRKLLSIILALTLCIGAAVPALAASNDASASNAVAVQAANRLYTLGLFNGVGVNADGTPNFDLTGALDRQQAVTMLVRLLGKEGEAQSGILSAPFTDVESWARPYVGYAYQNGLTSGTSATTFGGTENVSATQYLTFILRALGYSSDTDFAWDAAWELTDELRITNGEYGEGSILLRGDAAIISDRALEAGMKGGGITLLDTIVDSLTRRELPSVQLPGMPMDFILSSGAGAWGTSVTISSDGTFVGQYNDIDAGVSDEAYPGGTMALCNFSGKFKDVKKLDELTYSMRIDYLDTEEPPGREYISGYFKIVTSEPYGFHDADLFYLYLPGSRIATLPQDFIDWVSINWWNDEPEELPFYGLYNVGGMAGFASYDSDATEPAATDMNSGEVLYEGIPISQFLGASLQTWIDTFGEPDGDTWGYPPWSVVYKNGTMLQYDMQAPPNVIWVIENIPPNMAVIDGVTLDKTRAELVSALGEPSSEYFEENIGDTWTPGYNYSYDMGHYSFVVTCENAGDKPYSVSIRSVD